jgi:hypothetical protein
VPPPVFNADLRTAGILSFININKQFTGWKMKIDGGTNSSRTT